MRVWKKSCRRYRFNYRSRVLFLLPGLTGVSVFVLIPFLDVGKRSFQTAITGEFCGIGNYVTIFHNQAFLLALGNTARFVAVGLPLLLVCSLFLALMIDGCVHTNWWKAVYLFPMAVPTATVVLIWKLLFHQNGMLNGLLQQIGGNECGLDGQQCVLLGTDYQLSLEKYGLYHCALDGGIA